MRDRFEFHLSKSVFPMSYCIDELFKKFDKLFSFVDKYSLILAFSATDYPLIDLYSQDRQRDIFKHHSIVDADIIIDFISIETLINNDSEAVIGFMIKKSDPALMGCFLVETGL
jgi:hypothetical protein